MKILVLSDSHSGLSFMRFAVDCVRPDAVIHLGDYYDDGETIAQEYPHIPFYRMPGNCDKFRAPQWAPVQLCCQIGGVKLFMTHGHNHSVKLTRSRLMADARAEGARAALYGHTHCADCHQEEDGLWVFNPGSCGSFGGTVGLMEIEKETIKACRILRQEDLEAMK